jgi:hypothetical protein
LIWHRSKFAGKGKRNYYTWGPSFGQGRSWFAYINTPSCSWACLR